MSEVKLNKDNFEKEVLKSDIPVVVDFYADWCGPCKMLGTILEQVDFIEVLKIFLFPCDCLTKQGFTFIM